MAQSQAEGVAMITNAPRTGKRMVEERTGTLCFQNLLAGGHSGITVTGSEPALSLAEGPLELQRLAPQRTLSQWELLCQKVCES